MHKLALNRSVEVHNLRIARSVGIDTWNTRYVKLPRLPINRNFASERLIWLRGEAFARWKIQIHGNQAIEYAWIKIYYFGSYLPAVDIQNSRRPKHYPFCRVLRNT